MKYEIENYNPEELDNCMKFVPGGKFIFGLKETEKLKLAKEFDVHPDMLYFHSNFKEIDIKPFWIDKYPVTVGQFLRFMNETGYKIEYNGYLVGWTELVGWGNFKEDQYPLPMVGVNAIDAENYAKWLGKRLPTEIEWEKAWRGTDGRLFPWGNKWEEVLVFRNHGGTSLGISIPVGIYPEIGPYGLNDFSLVLEWVKTVFPAQSKQGIYDENPYILAGGSFFNTQPYTFLPSNRFSWSSGMRIYNSGFRCVSEKPPKNLVKNPVCKIKKFEFPQVKQIKKEIYLKEKIKLTPLNWATILIHVPWFSESVWVLDCPEITWDEFGGANSWPGEPEKKWKIDWQVKDNGSYASYLRRTKNKEIFFEIYSEGSKVYYLIRTKNLPVKISNFCLKTFSPFFSSQERVTQTICQNGKFISLIQKPINPEKQESLAWNSGTLKNGERFSFLSFDKKGKIGFPEGKFTFLGNGWPPCTHIIRNEINNVNEFSGFYSFEIE